MSGIEKLLAKFGDMALGGGDTLGAMFKRIAKERPGKVTEDAVKNTVKRFEAGENPYYAAGAASVQDDVERYSDGGLVKTLVPKGFVSKLGEALTGKFSRSKLPMPQWEKTLSNAGVKKEEMDWVLRDLKDREGPVSADELVRAWEERTPKMEERVRRAGLHNQAPMNDPRFEQYSSPGGSNYREVLMKTPAASKEELNRQAVETYGYTFDELPEPYKAAVIADAPKFYTGHWPNDPNTLLHLRMKDYAAPEGKRTLLVDELQSDWHQKGRKTGYASDVKKGVDDLIAAERRLIAGQQTHAPDIAERQAEYDRLNRLYGNMVGGSGVPDAPFKKSWHELGMKRALKEAVEGGYDELAWTGGAEQAKRYDLSKQLSRIKYNAPGGRMADKHGTVLQGFDHEGRMVLNETVPLEDLPDFVGKDLAKKIQEDAAKDAAARSGRHALIKQGAPEDAIAAFERDNPIPSMEYSGLDLSVGGEGMKGFYDKMLPDYMKKFGPVGQGPLPGVEAPVHTFQITPEIREKVAKGLPLWAVGGAAMVPTIDQTVEQYADGGLVGVPMPGWSFPTIDRTQRYFDQERRGSEEHQPRPEARLVSPTMSRAGQRIGGGVVSAIDSMREIPVSYMRSGAEIMNPDAFTWDDGSPVVEKAAVPSILMDIGTPLGGEAAGKVGGATMREILSRWAEKVPTKAAGAVTAGTVATTPSEADAALYNKSLMDFLRMRGKGLFDKGAELIMSKPAHVRKEFIVGGRKSLPFDEKNLVEGLEGRSDYLGTQLDHALDANVPRWSLHNHPSGEGRLSVHSDDPVSLREGSDLYALSRNPYPRDLEMMSFAPATGEAHSLLMNSYLLPERVGRDVSRLRKFLPEALRKRLGEYDYEDDVPGLSGALYTRHLENIGAGKEFRNHSPAQKLAPQLGDLEAADRFEAELLAEAYANRFLPTTNR